MELFIPVHVRLPVGLHRFQKVSAASHFYRLQVSYGFVGLRATSYKCFVGVCKFMRDALFLKVLLLAK